MNNKKKRRGLTYAETEELLKKVKGGRQKSEILCEFQVPNSTYYSLVNREQEILKNNEKVGMANRKSQKGSDYKLLDDALIKWF